MTLLLIHTVLCIFSLIQQPTRCEIARRRNHFVILNLKARSDCLYSHYSAVKHLGGENYNSGLFQSVVKLSHIPKTCPAGQMFIATHRVISYKCQ